MYAGIDIGSSSSKVAILNEEKEIVAIDVINLGAGTGGPEDAMNAALAKAGITFDELKYVVATGYGRIAYKQANKQITEISCHARGVSFLTDNRVSTIIDIGGQDAKIIRVDENGNVKNFIMNEKCAAGTGRFLEVMARVLGCGISDLSEMADRATEDIPISSVCTVFAESEVISRLATGATTVDVAKGAHKAVAKRIAGMCARVGIAPVVVMSGGGALNENLVKMIQEELAEEVTASPYPQAAGAIGAAVYAYEQINK